MLHLPISNHRAHEAAMALTFSCDAHHLLMFDLQICDYYCATEGYSTLYASNMKGRRLCLFWSETIAGPLSNFTNSPVKLGGATIPAAVCRSNS